MAASGTNYGAKSLGKFDLSGEKYAYVFFSDLDSQNPSPSNVADANLICKTLDELGFKLESDAGSLDKEQTDDAEMKSFDSEDEDEVNLFDWNDEKWTSTSTQQYNPGVIRDLSPLDMFKFSEQIAANREGASGVLLYIAAPQDGYNFFSGNAIIPVGNVLTKLKKLSCPKIVLLQGNVSETARMVSVLLNTSNGQPGNTFYLPESANILVSYLPNIVNQGTSTAKVICEEIAKPFDIQVNMTAIIDRLVGMGVKPIPKFASTLTQLLYLREGGQGVEEPEAYPCERGKCLTFSFHFGHFSNQQLENHAIHTMIPQDTKNLKDALEPAGFKVEFCVKDGIMTVKQFQDKLKGILQNKKMMANCDCIMIVLWSHGSEGGVIHAYDGSFNVNDVLDQLWRCMELEGKPKLLMVNACRGCNIESLGRGEKSFSIPMTKEQMGTHKNQGHHEMPDTLVALSSTAGNLSFGNAMGSRFIYHLCETLKRSGKKEHFFTVLSSTMVAVGKVLKRRYVAGSQQVTFTSTLRKPLYFSR